MVKRFAHVIFARLFIGLIIFFSLSSHAMEQVKVLEGQQVAWNLLFNLLPFRDFDEYSFAQTNKNNYALVSFMANERKNDIKKFIKNNDQCRFTDETKMVWHRSGKYLGIADISYTKRELCLYTFACENNKVLDANMLWTNCKATLPYDQFPFFNRERGWCFFVYKPVRSYKHGEIKITDNVVERCSLRCVELSCVLTVREIFVPVLMSWFITFPVLLKAILNSPCVIEDGSLCFSGNRIKKYDLNTVTIHENYTYFQEFPFADCAITSFDHLPPVLRDAIVKRYGEQSKN